MLDPHVAQQLSTLVAGSGGEDFGSCRAGDRYGCLAYVAGRRVDQDPVARGNPGLIV
jgi:hypothetical protein